MRNGATSSILMLLLSKLSYEVTVSLNLFGKLSPAFHEFSHQVIELHPSNNFRLVMSSGSPYARISLLIAMSYLLYASSLVDVCVMRG